MTDHHVVNKVFNERFYDRQNYMTLVKRDMEDMSQEGLHEVAFILNMNNLFCVAYVLANC